MAIGGEVAQVRAQAQVEAEQLGLVIEQAEMRVGVDVADRAGLFGGDGLDLDATFGRAHEQHLARAAVEDAGEVVLVHDVGRRRDQHPPDRDALDVHAQDLTGDAAASSGVAASLTPPALPRPPTSTCALITTLSGAAGQKVRGCHSRRGRRISTTV